MTQLRPWPAGVDPRAVAECADGKCEDAHELVEAIRDGEDARGGALLPCGHSAFVKVGGELECKVCGERHRREEVDA